MNKVRKSSKKIKNAIDVLKSVANKTDDQNVVDYYKQIQSYFDKYSKVPGVKYDLSYYTKPGFKPTPQIYECLKPENDGRIYLETIRTVMLMVTSLFLNKEKAVALLGLVQSAKTHSQILGAILSSMLQYLRDGIYTHPIFFIPNMKGNYLEQFQIKCKELLTCFKKVEVHYQGKSISVGDYLETAQFIRNKALEDVSADAYNLVFSRAEWIKFEKERDRFDANDVMILPLSSRLKNFIQILFVALARGNQRAILGRDEAHAAAGVESVGDKMMSAKDIMTTLQKEDQAIYDAINASDGNWQFIATSATNFGALHIPCKIPVYINKNYRGIDFGYFENGQTFRVAKYSDITITPPDFISQTEFGKVLNDPYFRWIVPSWYVTEEFFLKNLEKNNLQNLFFGWNDYRRKVARSLAKSVNFTLKSGIKNGNKMLLRFCNNNIVMTNLLADMKQHLDNDIKVIPEFGGSHKTIKELLKLKGVKSSDSVLLVPSAGCRMSDTLNREFCYGFDYTNKSDTLQALLQGVLGRMSGYFKDPLVMLSDDNAKELKELIDNDFVPTPGTKLSSDTKAPTQGSYETFRVDHYDNDIIREIIGRFQVLINKQPINYRKTAEGNLPTISLGKHIDGCFLSDYITDEGMEILAQFSRQRLMRYDEKDKNRRQYLTNINGDVVMGIRGEGNGRHNHRGGRPGDKTKSGEALVRGMIRVEFRAGRGKPKAVVTGFDVPVFQESRDIESTSSLTKIKGKK